MADDEAGEREGSGKEKAHQHKQYLPVIALVGGGRRVKQVQCGKLGNRAQFGHFKGLSGFLAIATRKPYLYYEFQYKITF